MSPWAQTCSERLAAATTWDQTNKHNRAGVRAWRRRLWWARYGLFIYASTGAVIGTALGAAIVLTMKAVSA